MNKREFLLSSISVPVCASIPDKNSWSVTLPCGQLVQFTKVPFDERVSGEFIIGVMTRRGVEYSLGTGNVDNPVKRLSRSFNVTCHSVDARDGFTDESNESWNYYLGADDE